MWVFLCVCPLEQVPVAGTHLIGSRVIVVQGYLGKQFRRSLMAAWIKLLCNAYELRCKI